MRSFLAAAITALVVIYVLKHPVESPAAKQAVLNRAEPESGPYYLQSYFSTQTPKGVIGWTAGQEVFEDKHQAAPADMIAVSDGQRTAIIPRALVTRDAQLADALRYQDQMIQDETKNLAAAESALDEAKQKAARLNAAARMDYAEAAQIASSSVGSFRSRINAPAYTSQSSAGYESYYEVIPVYTRPSTIIVLPSGATTAAAALPTPAARSVMFRSPYAGDHYTQRPSVVPTTPIAPMGRPVRATASGSTGEAPGGVSRIGGVEASGGALGTAR